MQERTGNMIINLKVKEGSSRAIAGLLLHLAEACRQGDGELAEAMGFDLETLRQLEKLSPVQIENLSSTYMKPLCAVSIFNIDSNKMSSIIASEAEKTRELGIVDEYLKLGASKQLMNLHFGWRSTQVASRKRFLDLPTVKGRLSISLEEERAVYDAWLETVRDVDVRERYLRVATITGITLSKIFRIVTSIENIETNKLTSKCA